MLTQDEEELYDRQIRLWGVNAQARIRQSKVLLLGFNGIASEVAKILVLAGIDSLTIIDDQPLQESDIQSNLFCRPNVADKKYRTEEVKSKLKVLNPLVKVNIDNTSKIPSDFKDYDLVTLTSFKSIDEVSKINDTCKLSNTKFYLVLDFGFYGFMFSDLGENFKFAHEQFESVTKQYGTQKDPISLGDDESENVSDDGPRKKRRKVESPPEEYEKDAKRNIVDTLSYVSFRDMISMRDTVFTKQTNPVLFISIAMFKFLSRFNHLPQSKEDKSELNSIIASMKDSLNLHPKIIDKLDESWLDNIHGSLSPVCAIVGGVAGQDMIRALANKDIPIVNTFSFDGISMEGTVEKVGLVAKKGLNQDAKVRDVIDIDDD